MHDTRLAPERICLSVRPLVGCFGGRSQTPHPSTFGRPSCSADDRASPSPGHWQTWIRPAPELVAGSAWERPGSGATTTALLMSYDCLFSSLIQLSWWFERDRRPLAPNATHAARPQPVENRSASLADSAGAKWDHFPLGW